MQDLKIPFLEGCEEILSLTLNGVKYINTICDVSNKTIIHQKVSDFLDILQGQVSSSE